MNSECQMSKLKVQIKFECQMMKSVKRGETLALSHFDNHLEFGP